MSFENTNDYKTYRKFVQFMKYEQVFYKNISVLSPSVIYLYDLFWQRNRRLVPFLYELIAVLFKRLNTGKILDGLNQTQAIVSFDYRKRKDHLSLCKSISSSIKNCSIVTLSYFYLPFFNIIDFFHIYMDIKHKLKKNGCDYLFKNLLLLVAYILYSKRVVDSLYNNVKKEDVKGLYLYIPFCSSVYTEAIITQYMNLLKIRTVHIFHGFFGRYKEYIANDVVNGINITAKEIWAFGDIQKEDLIRDFQIPSDIISIMGNPKYPQRSIKVRKSFRNCIIFGPIPLYDAQFKELLVLLDSISEEYGINFTLKPHPLSNMDYSSILKNIKVIKHKTIVSELLNSGAYDGAITYNTFCYYECLYWGILPLRWGKSENIDYEGLNDKFYDKVSFIDMVKQKSSLSNEILEKEIVILLQKSIGYKINNIAELSKRKKEN